MKRNSLLILVLLLPLFMGGCKKETVPEGILPEKKMVKVLIDMHIADAKVNLIHLPPDSLSAVGSAMEDAVLKKHKVKRKTYVKSFNYYVANVKKFEKIYESVVDSLSLRERLKKI